MSSPHRRRTTSSTHKAHRPRSTASAPSSYFSAFTNPYNEAPSTTKRSSSGTTKRTTANGYVRTTNSSTRGLDNARDRGFANTFGSYLPGFGWASTERGSSTSAYKRSPRQGWFARVWSKIRRYIRDFVRYARRHPFKVIVPLIMAIMGSGALAGLVKRMGGLEGLGLGGLKGMGLERWIGVGQGVRTGVEGFGYGVGGRGSGRGGRFEDEMFEARSKRGGGWMDNVGLGGVDSLGVVKGAVKVAGAFL